MSIIIIIMLGLQQSPGRCKTPTWKSLSTRLPVLTSRLITTLERPQVRISSACRWPTMSTMCLTELSRLSCRPVPRSRRHKGRRAMRKNHFWVVAFFSRDYNCVNSSCLCRPKNSFCFFFVFCFLCFGFYVEQERFWMCALFADSSRCLCIGKPNRILSSLLISWRMSFF